MPSLVEPRAPLALAPCAAASARASTAFELISDRAAFEALESEWNALGKWQGQADPPLTEVGLRQALAAGEARLADVFVLAGLYTHRILAGAIATGIAPSFWLLALSMFFFLSLAMLKRYSELIDLVAAAPAERQAKARGYRAEDLDTLVSLGSASGFSSVFVLALYIDSPNVRALYKTPELFWLCCPLLLYWLSRMWVGARRGVIDDDPLVFALREKKSLLILGVMLLLAALSTTVDFRCLLLGRCG